MPDRSLHDCRWVYDKSVPGGKFLVPGCINRAVYGDAAVCHCPNSQQTRDEKIEQLEARIKMLEAANV